MSALGCGAPPWDSVWQLYALSDFCNTAFPEDPPKLGLEPLDGEFVLMLKTRVESTPELLALAAPHLAAGKQVKHFNVEAARLTHGMLETLRDRINALLETP